MTEIPWSQFLKAGNATFTIVSQKTGARYTLKITRWEPEKGKVFYNVKYLNGPDNTGDYAYLGQLTDDGAVKLTSRSHVTAASTLYKAASWALWRLTRDMPTAGMDALRADTCCVCGRDITAPSSIDARIGPTCAKKFMARMGL